MKQKRYAQLLSTTTAIQTTATFINSQVADFATKFKTGYAELSSALDCITDTLKCAANDAMRQQIQQALHKKQQELTKVFERPALLYQKEINRLAHTLEKRIAPELLSPCQFDVKRISHILEQTKPLLDTSAATLEACLLETRACYERISALQRQNAAGDNLEDGNSPSPHPRL